MTKDQSKFFHLYHKKDTKSTFQFVQSFEKLKEARRFAGYLLIKEPKQFKIVCSTNFRPKITV